MSNFQIKLIALITMTIDHIGYFLFPQAIILRIIGRIAFILFAFLAVEGAEHTKNFPNYIKRMAIMGLICQIPDLIGIVNYQGNIFITLSLGLIIIYALKFLCFGNRVYVLGLIFLFAYVVDIDYGIYGLLVMIMFYLFKKYQIEKIYQILIYIILHLFAINFLNISALQMYGIMGLFITLLYNKRRGYNNQKLNIFMYWYYPIHITILNIVMFVKY